jgi:hypothetical protein
MVSTCIARVTAITDPVTGMDNRVLCDVLRDRVQM